MSSLASMMGQVKNLHKCKGIQCLLDEAAEILGNPIVMFNTEYNLEFFTEVETDDPLWNEIITTGTFGLESQKLFRDLGFIEIMANVPKSAILRSEKLLYDRFHGKLFSKNGTHVSNLVMMAANKPFGPYDFPVFEAICAVINKMISQIAAFADYEQAHQETIIKDLIDGNSDVDLSIGQVNILYDALKSGLYIAVVDVPACHPLSLVETLGLLSKEEPTYKYAIYDGRIVLLISTEDAALPVMEAFEKLLPLLDAYNLYAGISSRFENLFELKIHYEDALAAMGYAKAVRSTQRIFPLNPSSVKTMAAIQSLENGRGIQYLSDMALQVLGNPVLFHDMELRLLSRTQNVEFLDPICDELITYGTCSDETIALLKELGFVDCVEHTKAGALLKSSQLKRNRFSWKIYNRDDIMVGCLVMTDTMKPFAGDDPVLFGTFCQVYTREVATIDFYASYGQAYSGTVINRLISGTLDDPTFFSEDIGNLYNNLMDNLYLVVVDPSETTLEKVSLSTFRALFRKGDTVKRYALYGPYTIIIISTACTSPDAPSAFEEMQRMFEKNNIYGGVSGCFDNIYELQKHYQCAVAALERGRAAQGTDGTQRVFRHQEEA